METKQQNKRNRNQRNKHSDTFNKNFHVLNYNIDKETLFSFTWFIAASENDAFCRH